MDNPSSSQDDWMVASSRARSFGLGLALRRASSSCSTSTVSSSNLKIDPASISAEVDQVKDEENDDDEEEELLRKEPPTEEDAEEGEAKDEPIKLEEKSNEESIDEDDDQVGGGGGEAVVLEVLKPTQAPLQVSSATSYALIDFLDDFDAATAANALSSSDTRCESNQVVGPTVQQLPAQSPEELAVSKKMTRLFYLADFMISSSLESLNTPEEFSLAYFEHVTSSLIFYSQELRQLASTAATDAHFLLITKKVQQLQQHLSQLDKLKVRSTKQCSCFSPTESGNSSSVVIGDTRADTDQEAQRESIPSSPTPTPPPLPSAPTEKLAPFDGDILNWLLFSSAFQSIVANSSQLTTDPGAQFRLLLQSISDEATRVRFLYNVDPTSPDMSEVLHRLTDHFTGSTKRTCSLLKLSLGRLPALKNRYCPSSWLALMKAANQAVVMLANVYRLHNEIDEQEQAVAGEALVKTALLGKLPPRYQNLFIDGLGEQTPSLEHFAAFCGHQLAVIDGRRLQGLPVDGVAVSDVLCPICEGDYHQPEQCEFDLTIRQEAVKAKELCTRCLHPATSSEAHHCIAVCSRCGKRDHHVALCEM